MSWEYRRRQPRDVAFEKEKQFIDAHDVYEATQKIGMVTDVFHYIVSLKSKQREQTSEKSAPAKETPSPVQEPAVQPEANANQHAIRPQQTFQPDYDVALESEEKSMKGPVILLITSIATIIGSFYFYCQQAKSPGLMSCILDLLGL